MQSQKERSQHAADQFHAAAVDGDVEDFELTVRSWAGPVAVPAGSATITAPEESRRLGPLGGDTNPQQDAELPSTTEQQTWLPQINPHMQATAALAAWNKLHEGMPRY
jgi:hypothetical protein